MMNYSEFPPEQTAEIFRRLKAAGDGAVVRVLYLHTERGDGFKNAIDIRSAENRNAKAEDCEEPVNKAHTCPPTC